MLSQYHIFAAPYIYVDFQIKHSCFFSCCFQSTVPVFRNPRNFDMCKPNEEKGPKILDTLIK